MFDMATRRAMRSGVREEGHAMRASIRSLKLNLD